MLRGGVGFALVSLAAFSVWVFGDKWFHRHGGVVAMYAGCLLVFLMLSGLLLRSLLADGGLARFYLVFVPAFLAYALLWCAGWFLLGPGRGEWLGALAGTTGFAVVLSGFLGNARWLPVVVVVLFLGHSAGYVSGGGICYSSLHSLGGKLAWGLLYGLGFGAGIGFAFAFLQRTWKRPT
jgi:hypothetical protein